MDLYNLSPSPSFQVFLEPFSRVLGGQAKSKAVLLSTARSNLRHLNCLHQLGIVLGITDWVKDYHTKLSPPQNQDLSQNQAQTPPADQTKVRTGEITISDGVNSVYILNVNVFHELNIVHCFLSVAVLFLYSVKLHFFAL